MVNGYAESEIRTGTMQPATIINKNIFSEFLKRKAYFMKDFFKYMAATVAGLIVFTLLTGVLGVMCIAGMIASESQAKDVSDNTVMVLNLSGMLNERSEDNFMDQLSGSTVGNIGLDDILDAIKKAKNNDKIKGIYIEAGMFGADSYASMQAIRNALKDFKKLSLKHI